ncbi:MAG: DHHC palmitoyltransferase-domain-containing protein [Piptocephalis tieghemiana]|nr:MAG: DHHC palmitoyltransferase-domain-containing protein [Piptocephalis tieghemiana]
MVSHDPITQVIPSRPSSVLDAMTSAEFARSARPEPLLHPRPMPPLAPLPGKAPAKESKTMLRLMQVVSWLPVVLCLAIVAWSYYAFVFSLSIRHLILTQGRWFLALVYLLVHHILIILFMWSYANCMNKNSYGERREEEEGDEGGAQDPLLHRDQTSTPQDTPLPSSASVSPDVSLTIHSPDQDNPWTDSHEEDTLDHERPQGLYPQAHEGDPPLTIHPSSSLTVKGNGLARWCKRCKAPKPDRAHHCSVCRQCVLKMDHHCPWINNCVGHRNQKPFLLFVLWGAAYCTWCALAILPPLYEVLSTDPEIELVDINWIFLILGGGLFGICLWGFAGFHVHMVFNNRTTIEGFQQHRYRRDLGNNAENLFDLGWRDNWKQVMGNDRLLWFIPIANPLGDGRTFPIRLENRPEGTMV